MTMASLPLDCVDIFDDFDDADSMEVTYCKLVSDEQFEEDTRSETDKALGELCMYLDQNPELYARVLRKRKQEEMESSGVISYVKSKMMSFLHGEQYPHCLVSAGECVQQTNALKAGMCKTFQLSQELKGNVTRHSARLAAKKQAKMSNKTNLVLNGKDFQAKLINTSVSSGKPASSDSAFTGNMTASEVDLSGAHPTNLTTVSSPKSSLAAVPTILVSQGDGGNNSSKGNGAVGVQSDNQHKSSSPEGINSRPALLKVSSSTVVTPPPAPPLPANFPSSAISKQSHQATHQTPASARKTRSPRSHRMTQSPKPHRKTQSPETQRKTQSPKSHRKTQLPKLHTPKSAELTFPKKRRSSPRALSHRLPMGEVPTRSSSLQNLSALSRSSSVVSSPFLTPEIPSRFRTHKRTGSNSSLSSLSSYGSCSSINSEILLSNPISRLKATPVIRSPGGTPLRQRGETVLSEPLHRALYTAIRSRFRNVNTPSPRSGDASISASNNSVFNNTFSP